MNDIPDRHRTALEKIARRLPKRRCCSCIVIAGGTSRARLELASIIATRIDRNLQRVDLSGIVSKYIGETEKTLSKIFDRAEKSCAVLLLDEADALFGKRADVKDSHDRSANMETSYLLQRLENFNGIAILASNRRGNLDKAFVRRFDWIVSLGDKISSRRRARQGSKRKSGNVIRA
jgi:SpoVK/Ycf46/Vps4 family AAA+-type ATPase